MKPLLSRQNSIQRSKEEPEIGTLQQLSKFFIQFVQDVSPFQKIICPKFFLPIGQQSTNQLQLWVSFKSLIEPSDGKIEFEKISNLFLRTAAQNTKNQQKISSLKTKFDVENMTPKINEAEKENKQPAMNSFKKLNNLVLKELKKSNEQIYERISEKPLIPTPTLSEITSSLVQLFDQNEPHIEILCNMNQNKSNPNIKQNEVSSRKANFKRQNTTDFKIY